MFDRCYRAQSFACMSHDSRHEGRFIFFCMTLVRDDPYIFLDKTERIMKVDIICIVLLQGLKIDIRTQNRTGLLSKVTRIIRENGLSITRVEIGVEGETAVGSFYVIDSSGQAVNTNIAELVRREIGGSIVAVQNSPYRVPQSSSSSTTLHETETSREVRPRFSLGSMLWSHLEHLSNNLGPIRS